MIPVNTRLSRTKRCIYLPFIFFLTLQKYILPAATECVEERPQVFTFEDEIIEVTTAMGDDYNYDDPNP